MHTWHPQTVVNGVPAKATLAPITLESESVVMGRGEDGGGDEGGGGDGDDDEGGGGGGDGDDDEGGGGSERVGWALVHECFGANDS